MKCNCYNCLFYAANEYILGEVEINEFGRCIHCNFMKIKDKILEIKAQLFLDLESKNKQK